MRLGSGEFELLDLRDVVLVETEPGWSAGRASPVEKLNGKFPEGSESGLSRP